MSEQDKQRMLRNAIILRTGKFYDKGVLKDATDKQMKQAASILRRLGEKQRKVNKEIRDFRAKKKGFSQAYMGKWNALREQYQIPTRKGEPKNKGARKGVNGLVYLGAL